MLALFDLAGRRKADFGQGEDFDCPGNIQHPLGSDSSIRCAGEAGIWSQLVGGQPSRDRCVTQMRARIHVTTWENLPIALRLARLEGSGLRIGGTKFAHDPTSLSLTFLGQPASSSDLNTS